MTQDKTPSTEGTAPSKPAWMYVQTCQEDIEKVIRQLSYVMAYSHLNGDEHEWRLTRQLAPAVAALAAGADALAAYTVEFDDNPMGAEASTGTVDVPETDPDDDEPLRPCRPG